MVGTIRYNNGVRSNSIMPAVAGVEQEWAILRCMSVGTVEVRLQKETSSPKGNDRSPESQQVIKIF